MRIFVVEDNLKHMEEATKVIEAAGHEVVSAANFFEARDRLRSYIGADGAIVDIFIPESDGDNKEADQPRGLGVALMAERQNIPFVFCTSGYHHGNKYNWICYLGRDRGWEEIVDKIEDEDYEAGRYDAESPSKDWETALDTLTRLINRKKQ
jgi:CheY-like chemotaxis protein